MAETEGRVLTAHSSRYDVLGADGSVVPCRARRRMLRPDSTCPSFPVPGDMVVWQALEQAGAKSGIILGVRPRHSEIARVRSGEKHVVLANLDRLVIVVAVQRPSLDRGLLDRLLTTAERNRIDAMICLHKFDLVEPGECDDIRRVYERAGYPVLPTSCTSGEGIEELRMALKDHLSAFMGASGAGKSHLISSLQPGLSLRTGMVSEVSGQGRHTTTRVDLHRTEFGALLADTPGVREFSLWGLQQEELRDLFPEFRDLQPQCHYATCTHDHEPRCAVKDAVAAGDVDSGRYRSYVAILTSLRHEPRTGGHSSARRQEDERA